MKIICMWLKHRFVNSRSMKKTFYAFILENLSIDSTKCELNEVSLNSTVYDLSLDHSAIEKEHMLFKE